MRRLLVVLVAVVLTASCDNSSPRATPSDTPVSRPAPTTPTEPADPPSPVLRDPKVACGGRDYNTKQSPAFYPDGQPYAGKGIHHLVMAAIDNYNAEAVEDLDSTKLPNLWSPGSVPGMYPDRFTQLLLCVYQDRKYPGRTVDTCKYKDGDKIRTTAKLLSARYQYRLLEAKTGRQITTFSMTGTEDTCPAIVHSDFEGRKYYQIVSDAALTAKLRPYVEGTAR